MASCEATGPPGMVCVPPETVVTSVKPAKFCTTPPAIRAIAPIRAIGSRMRPSPRIRSTQKLPIVVEPRRARPRVSATATARPTAAETKFCTVRPASCTV